MRHSLALAPQFYVTAPQPCPYLDGRVERKLFTTLKGDQAETLNNALSKQGFRRSQNVAYRQSCSECSACLSARIDVGHFTPTRGQKRIVKRNAHLERSDHAPWATEEQYDLFRKYLNARHPGGGMADMDIYEFVAMLEETPITTRVVEYRVPSPDHAGRMQLVAVCLVDILDDGISLVYSFYDPDFRTDSLGIYMILDHITAAHGAALPYVYLGYWVPGSPKMAYKANFAGVEVYAGRIWQALKDPAAFADLTKSVSIDPVSDQVAQIELPQNKP